MTCESCAVILEENKKLKKRLDELEKRLNVYENPHTPPSKKHFSPRPKSNGKPGQKKGHEGTTRDQAEPDKTITLTAKKCPHCGAKLKKPNSFRRRVIEDIPPIPQRTVTEFLIGCCYCDNCGKEVIPTHPELPKEGRFGKNLISHTTMMKYSDRIPHRKIRKALKRQFGIYISSATILDLTRRACNVLRPEYERILERIRNSKAVYSDETGMKVNGEKHWIWIFVSGNDVLVVINKSRGRAVPEEILGNDYKGIVVCDGWKAYRMFAILQRCWAHLLREADELANNHEEANSISDELHSIFNDCKQMIGEDPPPDKRKRIWDVMNARMRNILNMNCTSEPIRKFVKKVSNGFDHWFTFVLYPYVEPTNNIAERALRENVIHRKIIGTLRNGKGMFIHETAMSVIPSWENVGLNPHEQLVGLL